ncbi:MAG: sel1 repeat family protein, partial [Sphingomonadales bacterium]
MKQVIWTAAMAGALLAAPALADVKAGVEAWQRGDYRVAVSEWRGPAVAGDADAQFNMGQAYKFGRGVPADLAQAEEWYRKAALQGHPQAEENYGLALFENGKRLQAIEWLEKAAGRGAPRAQYVLGTMLFNGDAVTKDWVRAYALIVRAAAQGLPQASASQAQMDGYISLQDRQKALELARVYER